MRTEQSAKLPISTPFVGGEVAPALPAISSNRSSTERARLFPSIAN